MKSVAVFWTWDDIHEWIKSEFEQGRLRQGWGPYGSNLLENGQLIPRETWCANYAKGAFESWGNDFLRITDKQIRTRYSILSRMVQLQRGDLVIVPRMPETGSFTITKVSQGYGWDNSHFGKYQFPYCPPADLAHVLHVDPAANKVFGNKESLESRLLSEQFRNHRSAVSFIRNPEWQKFALNLYERE